MEKSRRDIVLEITLNAIIAATYAVFILLKRSKGFLRAINANQILEVKF